MLFTISLKPVRQGLQFHAYLLRLNRHVASNFYMSLGTTSRLSHILFNLLRHANSCLGGAATTGGMWHLFRPTFAEQ